MVSLDFKVKVDATGLNVPLMIIVDEKGLVHVYEKGKKVELVKSVEFEAEVYLF